MAGTQVTWFKTNSWSVNCVCVCVIFITLYLSSLSDSCNRRLRDSLSVSDLSFGKQRGAAMMPAPVGVERVLTRASLHSVKGLLRPVYLSAISQVCWCLSQWQRAKTLTFPVWIIYTRFLDLFHKLAVLNWGARSTGWLIIKCKTSNAALCLIPRGRKLASSFQHVVRSEPVDTGDTAGQ